MAETPPAAPGRDKGKQILGVPSTLFWGGLAVLGLGVAYFIYKRNAASQSAQQAGVSPLVVASPTGLSAGQLLTWISDHQGPPAKPKAKKPDDKKPDADDKAKPWPVDTGAR